MGAIKNVGDVAIDLIIGERNKNGLYKSFTDFCLRIGGQKVNKRVLESLIKVGAFDQFGERNAILGAIDQIKEVTDKHNKKLSSGQFGLFDGDSTQKTIIDIADKFPDVSPMSEKDKLAYEKTLLGIYVTENPISKMLQVFQSVSLPKINDLSNNNNTPIKLVAVINRIKTIRTKKDNSLMAFVTLEDESGQIDSVIFPKAYEAVASFIQENIPVYLEGKISLRNDEKSILIDTISQTLPQNVQTYDFVIEVPASTSQSQLMDLNRLLKNNPNGHRGLIILPNGKKIPLTYGVRYTPDLQTQINQILSIK
jgi:DNA polymerase-3 subunit alpha